MDPDWVDVFPIENGDVIAASYVMVYQRVPQQIPSLKLKVFL